MRSPRLVKPYVITDAQGRYRPFDAHKLEGSVLGALDMAGNEAATGREVLKCIWGALARYELGTTPTTQGLFELVDETLDRMDLDRARTFYRAAHSPTEGSRECLLSTLMNGSFIGRTGKVP